MWNLRLMNGDKIGGRQDSRSTFRSDLIFVSLFVAGFYCPLFVEKRQINKNYTKYVGTKKMVRI